MKYNDISPSVNAYADRRLLTRAKANNILAQFGQIRQLPKNQTQQAIFRRYNRLDSTPVELQEGVTPAGKTLTKTDYPVSIKQYGDWVGITDVILDTHTDPILNESVDVLGEQAPELYDKIYAGVLKAGTNVLYANGAARASVNSVITAAKLRTAVRTLMAQEAKPHRARITAGPNIGTLPVAAAFIAFCHSDLLPDLEGITGWKSVEEYASQEGLIEGEMGSFGRIRFVYDNNLTPWADAGGAKGNTLSTTGVSSDVYPILIAGKDSYGIVPLGGKNSVSTYVNNPKPIHGDELAQNGSVGWKGYTAAVILNDNWLLRIECAANG